MLPQAEYEKVCAIHDKRVLETAFTWSGGLGPWALDKRDTALLRHVYEVRIESLLSIGDFHLIISSLIGVRVGCVGRFSSKLEHI